MIKDKIKEHNKEESVLKSRTEELKKEITKEVFFKAGYKKAQEDFMKVISRIRNITALKFSKKFISIRNEEDEAHAFYVINFFYEELKKEVGINERKRL